MVAGGEAREGSRKEGEERGGLRKVWEGGWGSVISPAWSCPPFPAGLPAGHAHDLAVAQLDDFLWLLMPILSWDVSHHSPCPPQGLGDGERALSLSLSTYTGCILDTGSYPLPASTSGIATLHSRYGSEGCRGPEPGHVKCVRDAFQLIQRRFCQIYSSVHVS